MMNLELLFEATAFSGDSTFYNIAVKHADTTMAHHFRPDNSCYHVVDYDPETGEVRKRQTAQGYADESAWARGQAWALYGYTTCYRYTKDKKYLDQAQKVYNFIFTNKNLPEDLVPYWDYDAPNIPNEPRDALPLLVRLPPFTNWTVICRAIITRKLLIRSWKAWAHPLIVLKLEQMETLS